MDKRLCVPLLGCALLFSFVAAFVGGAEAEATSQISEDWLNRALEEIRRSECNLDNGRSATLGLGDTPDWTAELDMAYAYFGAYVSTAGDVNGDGYSDVIVGAFGYGNGQSNEGAAFVYHGSDTGLSTTADWSAESDLEGAQFGESVGTAGDVNGDGYSDVIVGAPHCSNPENCEGRVWVYHGSDTGLSTTADWTAESDQADAFFGISLGTAGDVNGDGYSDVIVGAQGYDNGELNEGGAFVYLGSDTGLSTTADWTAESDQEHAGFGTSVGTAGDVNGDGYSDVIVGALYYDNDQIDEGSAFVYLGSDTGLSTTADWTAESDQESAYFGSSVSTAGDVNGDSISDVIVGAYRYDGDQTDEGGAFVYLGSDTGLLTTADWSADESDQTDSRFAWSVSTAGDVNGDGYSDIIVGAPYFDDPERDEGRAWVYHGSPTGLSTTAAWTAESDQVDAWFAWSVSTAGDVNGDSISDVIVGAFWYENGQVDEGAAFVYHGEEEDCPCGDCNDDGRITVADAIYIVSYIYRDGPEVVCDCDVNLDARITVADAIYIVSYIYREGPPPCEPTPAGTFEEDRTER